MASRSAITAAVSRRLTALLALCTQVKSEFDGGLPLAAQVLDGGEQGGQQSVAESPESRPLRRTDQGPVMSIRM